MKTTDFKKKKLRHEKITMLTCYDYPSARIIAESHLDCVLVGDSVAMAVHGHDSTVMATIDMMVLHTQAVSRAIKKQLLITDLPFLCHRLPCEEAIRHVQQIMQAGAHAIKIEGGGQKTYDLIHDLVTAGVPVLGHLGLTPQSVHQLGGYRVQGKEAAQAELIFEQAKHLEQAGCVAIVLECVPTELAQTITENLSIPTIGIGAGATTDGQVLVWHDLLGIQNDFNPRFVKQYAQTNGLMLDAINAYVSEVKSSVFPSADHSF